MDQETQNTVELRKRVNLTLSLHTHTKLKVWCAERGQTMQSAIERMLDRAFEKADEATE
jgi:hypothetical protein